MYRICKRFTFEAAHKLEDLDKTDEQNKELYGKCSITHGHSYKIFVYLQSEKLTNGMIENFDKVKQIFMENIHKKYDHSVLNDNIGLPTAEIMAITIWNSMKGDLPELYKVRVYETESCWAE